MKISVILPAYNAENTIAEAIQSIIDQTYTDWELLVIDDGSKDNTKIVIQSFDDSRIKYIENDGNKKLIYTLNRGLELATGKYIARMDADDISMPKRFEKQLAYMEAHPDCVACGTFIQKFNEFGNIGKPVGIGGDDIILKEYLYRDACFAHPTVMLRGSCIRDKSLRYNEQYIHAEDFKFWVDLSLCGKFYNIPEPLLRYRVSTNQITQKYRQLVNVTSNKCRKDYILSSINDEQFLKDISSNSISIDTIIKSKSLGLQTYYLLEVLYLSLSNCSWNELFYLLFSGDFLRISFKTVEAFIKRLIKGRSPLL